MSLATDIIALLQGAGLVDGDSGWASSSNGMPPDNGPGLTGAAKDQTIAVGSYGGGPPSSATGLETPSAQLYIRGTRNDKDSPYDQLRRCYLFLHGTGPWVGASGTSYRWIRALQSEPHDLGPDQQDHRPEFTHNFEVGRSR